MLTKEEKVQIVKELLTNMQQSIVAKIEAGKVPEHWDGRQLRELIKDYATSNAYKKLDKKERKEYDHEVIINNL